jgi:Arc/MetJ-type ribon-helix-helix transcriptional regulator
MTITVELKPEQQKWLEDEVAAGHFASVDEALRVAVAELMRPLDTDDLSWAKPYLDEARAELERGEFVTLEDFNAKADELLRELERK